MAKDPFELLPKEYSSYKAVEALMQDMVLQMSSDLFSNDGCTDLHSELLNELLRITFFEADNQQSRPSITDLKRICADLVDKESDAEVRQGLTDIRDKLHNVYQ